MIVSSTALAGTKRQVDLSIVIVNWNTADLLYGCIDAIRWASGDLLLEIIVVDNASTDDSMRRIHSLPFVTCVYNGNNIGFARANNQGFELAHGRYVLMLNPDTVVLPGSLATMVSFMDDHPHVGAIGPKLLNADGSIQYSCAHFPSLASVLAEATMLNRLFPRSTLFSKGIMTHWHYRATEQVDQPSGACLLLRQDALAQACYLDNQFFVYLEEVDLCYRLSRLGWKIYYLPDAEVIHYGGQSSQQNLDVRIYVRNQSLLRYIRKHFPPWQDHLARAIVASGMVIRIATIPLVWRRLSVRPADVDQILDMVHRYVRVLAMCFTSGSQDVALAHPRTGEGIVEKQRSVPRADRQ